VCLCALGWFATKIIRGQYPPLSDRYSPELRALIDKMITRVPEQRPSINQILAEPIIKSRIHTFLSATLRADEFSHTIIHGRPKPGQLVPDTVASFPLNSYISPSLHIAHNHRLIALDEQ
jgi:NIMA (never in mitosis gene a)-related kinase